MSPRRPLLYRWGMDIKTPGEATRSYIPIANGGIDVNRRLYSIKYIWSIMTDPVKPQYSYGEQVTG